MHYNRDTCQMYDSQLKESFREIVDNGTRDIAGDVNNDGKFSISDVVLLQKWLLAVSDVKLDKWKSADLYGDGKLDVFDLCLMKQLLVK